MNKYTFSCFILFMTGYLMCFSQIGINTENPKALLHIHPNKDTNVTNDSINDFVITKEGKVGIGTLTPTNKLTISAETSTSDIYLPNGATAGAVLTSADSLGNAYWNTGSLQFYTIGIGEGNATPITSSSSYPQLTQFTNISFDNVKEIYGDDSGWNVSTQQYTVPRTGLYRISFSLYINQATDAATNPIIGYVYKNGSIFYEPGFITIAYTTKTDTKGFVSGIANLTKGDKIDFRIYSATNRTIIIYAAAGYTYFVIESL